MTGYPPSDIIGRNCRFLQGEQTDPATVSELRQAIQRGQPLTVELVNYRKDGTSFWNELSISPVRDDQGLVTHFVGVQSDVTGRRHLEAQLRQAQKMEAIGQLAAGLAHDFNNLLTIINGYVSLLLQGLPEADPSHPFLAEIKEAGERSALLTRQLLVFAGKQIVTSHPLDINRAISDLADTLNRTVGRDVEICLSQTENLPAVCINPVQFGHVVLNLMLNAQATMPHGGRITLATRNVELNKPLTTQDTSVPPGRYVLLTVTDTGQGMNDEQRRRLFEPFFTINRAAGGEAFGLAVAYTVVKQAGGHIDVQSQPGAGTSVRIYLPQVTPTDVPPGATIAPSVPAAGDANHSSG